MTEVEPALDFASSGRSGRRNALPDILGSPAGVSPSDLPLKLAELSLTGQPDTHTHTHTHKHTHTDLVLCALTWHSLCRRSRSSSVSNITGGSAPSRELRGETGILKTPPHLPQ
uniref:cAMP-dependent protein kinase inhibitor beta n=1 Tax=Cyprinus carpio TaxID=7962 RepID=A0A8C2I0C2_CYPCA